MILFKDEAQYIGCVGSLCL